MLPVSDLLEVAMNMLSTAEASARAPQRFSRARPNGPVIVWNVRVHCNMTCPHCYASAGLRPSPKDLTTAEAQDLLDQMAASGVSIVIFSGGEPLLRPDLFELLAHARSLGIAPQLSSNGTLIDEGMARRLAEVGVPYVGISIDGIREFNDPYRGMEGGTEAALAGLRFANAAGMRTGMRMTLTARNVDQLEAVLDTAREVGASRFYVSHLVYSGRGRRLIDDDLPRDRARSAAVQLFEVAEKLLERGHPLRIVTGSNDSDGPLLLRWIQSRFGAAAALPVEDLLRERGGNSAGERVLNIDHLG
ncbi:MAG: radical SAM protein, partial [bacterium]|nr:radical SAM protein [bacterium]